MHNQQIANLNRKYEAFWREQSDIALRLAKDDEIRGQALTAMALTLADRESVRRQPSFEQALVDAKDAREQFQRRHSELIRGRAQNAGRSKKGDRLHNFMKTALMRNSKLSLRDLWHQVERDSGPGQDFQIVDGVIEFAQSNGRELSVSLTGLKHRLWRMKKQMNKF